MEILTHLTARPAKTQTLEDSHLPTIGARVQVALAIGVLSAAFVAYRQFGMHRLGSDFLWLWRATKIVLDGGDPYMLIQPFGDADFTAGIWFYPLPAMAFALPVAWLSPEWAAIAFVGCSTFLLAFVITRESYHRLPMFLSTAFVSMCHFAQTSGLTLALALIPAAAGLTVMKPNLGLALFIRSPHWKTAIYGGALLVGSVLIVPSWPREWLHVIRTAGNHYSVMRIAGGAVVLLALLRWRTPEARLLVAMAVIPHALYLYDELPLWLIPRTQRESMTLTWCSWAALGGSLLTSYDRAAGTFDLRGLAPWSVWLLYVPCLVMVLRRPNARLDPTTA